MLETLRAQAALEALLVLAALVGRGKVSLDVTMDLADTDIQMRRPTTDMIQMPTKAAMIHVRYPLSSRTKQNSVSSHLSRKQIITGRH